MKSKKLISILVALLTAGLLIAFGVYFFWAYPHGLIRRFGIEAPSILLQDPLTGEYEWSTKAFTYIFEEAIPQYIKIFNENLFTADKSFMQVYPMYDLQIIKFIRIFFLAILGLFVILKALISKMSKKALIVPFILLIVTDFVLGMWTSVQCVRCVFAEELGLENMAIFQEGIYTRTMYNVTIDLWRNMITNWAFLVIDAVALVLIIASNKVGNIKLIGKYAYLIPGILAALVICCYVGMNTWKLSRNVFGMEVVALIIFAVAYFLLGWLLLRKDEVKTEEAPADEE